MGRKAKQQRKRAAKAAEEKERWTISKGFPVERSPTHEELPVLLKKKMLQLLLPEGHWSLSF